MAMFNSYVQLPKGISFPGILADLQLPGNDWTFPTRNELISGMLSLL
jgi:hypothetical protein